MSFHPRSKKDLTRYGREAGQRRGPMEHNRCASSHSQQTDRWNEVSPKNRFLCSSYPSRTEHEARHVLVRLAVTLGDLKEGALFSKDSHCVDGIVLGVGHMWPTPNTASVVAFPYAASMSSRPRKSAAAMRLAGTRRASMARRTSPFVKSANHGRTALES